MTFKEILSLTKVVETVLHQYCFYHLGQLSFSSTHLSATDHLHYPSPLQHLNCKFWKDLPSITRTEVGRGVLSTTWKDLPSIIRIEVGRGGGVVHHLGRLAFHNQDGCGGQSPPSNLPSNLCCGINTVG